MTFTDVNQARAVASAAHSEWWAAYMKDSKSEETQIADAKSKEIRVDVLTQFGKPNPKYPHCKQCLYGSVFGGPSHEASPRCKSGRHPHCTCDTCF